MPLRFQRENVLIVPERRSQGYEYDPSEQRFVKKLGTTPRPAGSGYSMMQLTWPGEAFTLVEEESAQSPGQNGAPAGEVKSTQGWSQLEGSVLDFLSKRGATWLLTRRLCDLSLYHPQVDGRVTHINLVVGRFSGANMPIQAIGPP